jgi:hypothetical protein
VPDGTYGEYQDTGDLKIEYPISNIECRMLKFKNPRSSAFIGGESFPLDSCGGFAGDVVDYPVDVEDFVYYAIGYYGEDFVGDS